MADGIQNAQFGTDRLTNAAVWSTIRYLDSCTDYREYLPQMRQQTHSGEIQSATRDRMPASSALLRIAVLAILACILLLILFET
jgi:hypothetical protein